MSATVRTTWKLLRPYARKHVGAFSLLFVLGSILAFSQRVIVVLVSPAIDVLFPDKHKAIDVLSTPSWAPIQAVRDFGAHVLLAGDAWIKQGACDPDATTDLKMAALLRIALIASALAFLAGAAQFAFWSLARWIAVRMVVDLRMQIARHLMGLSLSYHGRRHFGDLLSRISSDVNTTLAVLNNSLKELVQEPLTAVAALIIAAAYAPLPTLIVTVLMVFIAVPVARQSRKVSKGSTKSLTQLGSSVQALTQMFQGVRTVKAFRAEERELAEYGEINEGYVRSTMKMVRAQAMSHSITTFLSIAGMGIMVYVIGLMVLDLHTFSSGAAGVAAFFLSISAVYGSVKDCTRAVTNLQESVGASERIEALFREQPDVVERPNAHTIAGLGSGLRFERVVFTYPEGSGNAVESVDLHVRPGETLALVGASGSGKSTMVDLVARFIDPTKGRITVDGHDLRDLTIDSWTAQYAMVGQTPFLFHATIEENILYGKPNATQKEIEAAARAAGIHDFIAALPEGYKTNVADAGSRLSGGQRQRITIARAFLKGAPLLLLDEATSALDTESESIVQEALERLMADRTVIVIAHRLSTIQNADRIVVLENGRIVEEGTHTALLAKRGAYARLNDSSRRQAVPEVENLRSS